MQNVKLRVECFCHADGVAQGFAAVGRAVEGEQQTLEHKHAPMTLPFVDVRSGAGDRGGQSRPYNASSACLLTLPAPVSGSWGATTTDLGTL